MPYTVIPLEQKRRFFLESSRVPPKFFTHPVIYIVQGYLQDEPKTRIQDECRDGKHIYLLTRESGEGASRVEEKHEITQESFYTQWDFVKCHLSKSCYLIPGDNITLELNIFHGPLAGYVQIEVVFDTHKEALTFHSSPWFGKDVTNHPSHGDYCLAQFGIPQDVRSKSR